MDDIEFWRDVDNEFLRFSNKHHDRLVVHWKSTEDDPPSLIRGFNEWTFEGDEHSERTFKSLAERGGTRLKGKAHSYAWRTWLNALREKKGVYFRATSTRIIPPSEQPRSGGLLGRRFEGEVLTGVIETPFKTSALFCLEKVTEMSIAPRADPVFDWTGLPSVYGFDANPIESSETPDAGDDGGGAPETIFDIERRRTKEFNVAERQSFFSEFVVTQTISSIATRAAIEPSSLYRWLDGKSRLRADTRDKLATCLGVKPEKIPND